MKPNFAIVGCGKVGTALGKFLTKAGYNIAGLASKSLSSAKRAADIIKTNNISDIPWEVTKKADIVFLTTPDNAIADTCNNISTHLGFRKNAVVLHCSGALPSTILASAKKCNAFIGSMHPLQSFASIAPADNPFKDIIISVEGEKDAINKAGKIATDLGAECLTIKAEAKTFYHASAVVASNYLVTLLDMSFRLIKEAGITDRDAFKALKPLIQGTLSNIQKVGISKALTGPIVRGDIETVKRHLEEIGSKTPDLLDLYKTLGFHTIDIAMAGGSLSKSSAQNLKKIFSD
ncbi:MAG: Rossmann-like and DUF2520 domain-containing protein [Thermodesulfobacteriota bacterium]|nr:Rossmann-like and DUF2520 domain-containing protein [Thermodesulfobacteriota bacterium]